MSDPDNVGLEPGFKDNTIIEPLKLDDAQGEWVFAPRPDITALEAVLIAQLFSAIVVRYLKGDRTRFDWREYLTRPHPAASADGETIMLPHLQRHFREVTG